MPRNVCCVPGCPNKSEDGVPLHYFPNPDKDAERFQKWVSTIESDIVHLDSTTVYKTYRVCRQHFKEAFLYPKNRLCKLAVPSLLLPIEGISASSADQFLPDQPSTSHNVTLCLSYVERQKPIRKTVINRPLTSEELDYEIPANAAEVPAITNEEFVGAYNAIKNKKAPGMDSIPNVALKAAMKGEQNGFQEVFNSGQQ
ncbi:uncharacterized protein LOC123723002 [Papilio machaon]|uniref:uncharacterized protein LOC123723002 n=1 Tax=Papilio machaon TaxID=76193 RepID=UPI001E663454|nr:uncharacterized protein LOC123723002 [Papilio machaon]